ncbi:MULTISPECIES: GAF domain-containing protein [Streptomyces]|uniref:GAF domain-containing protein n=1 Tax=Streptomyces eurythermus TaxID=42237 RepID=A0ABW6Z525_9ACTN|nr:MULTISPECIES: GAF domain-containing protein [Streptomyces]QIS75152.1 GAF domain-containing protein [Streptomyces sp. DSM 40868]
MTTFNSETSRHGLPEDHELPRRLELLAELGLDQQRPIPELDALADRVADAFIERTGQPSFRGIVNIVAHEQFFVGLSRPRSGGHSTSQDPDPVADRIMPRTEGWCVFTLARRTAFPLNNVLDYPRSAGNGAMHRFRVKTYLGAPIIHAATGICLGTICGVGTLTTQWTLADVERMKEFAQEAGGLMEQRPRF